MSINKDGKCGGVLLAEKAVAEAVISNDGIEKARGTLMERALCKLLREKVGANSEEGMPIRRGRCVLTECPCVGLRAREQSVQKYSREGLDLRKFPVRIIRR